MLLGFNKQCITPNLPVKLGGYELDRVAYDIHDDLYIRCIVFYSNNTYYVFAQCDLIGIDTLLLDRVYEQVSHMNIKKEHIIITATHTHSGPVGVINTDTKMFSELVSIFGETDYNYINDIADKITIAIQESMHNMIETTVEIARGEIDGVGANRHNIEEPGDNSLLVYRFTREDQKQILLYNYACHPTVTGPNNTMITADFPYAVENKLPYDMCVFVNSCAGDISSRFTRIDSSFKQAEIYSHIIVNSIENALKHPVYTGNLTDINIKNYTLDMPIKKVKPIDESIKEYHHYQLQLEEAKKQNMKNLRVLESYVEGAKVAVSLSKCLEGIKSLDIQYSIIQLQDIIMVTIPGELFSSLGRVLKDQGIEVLGYGNGYYLYIADYHAYDNSYYEAMSSIFEKGAGELLIQDIIEKVKSGHL